LIRKRILLLFVPAAVAIIVMSAAQPVHADDIKTITGGSVSTTSRTAADVVVVGDGLFLSGHFTDGVGSSLMCDPCAPGDTVHLRSAWGGDIPNVVVKLDGHEAMNVILAGFFELDGGDVVVPDTNGPLLVLQSHFSLTKGSSLFGFTDPSETHQAFRFGVTGSGIVTLTARRGIGERPLYDRAQLNWVFTNAQVAATPEPASALLLLTGVGAVTAWRRRTRGSAF
jgi:hypothetical protein